MKTSLTVLEQADDALLKISAKRPTSYLKELEQLCRSCGWSLKEYWNASLKLIDNGWE